MKHIHIEGKTFCITGETEEYRDIYWALIVAAGGRWVRAVSRVVDYLVVGDEPGPTKMRLAEEYADYVKDRINQVLNWASATPEEFFRRLVEESLNGPENEEELAEMEAMEGLSAEESLSVRVWRARALQAEAELAELRAKLAELAGVSAD